MKLFLPFLAFCSLLRFRWWILWKFAVILQKFFPQFLSTDVTICPLTGNVRFSMVLIGKLTVFNIFLLILLILHCALLSFSLSLFIDSPTQSSVFFIHKRKAFPHFRDLILSCPPTLYLSSPGILTHTHVNPPFYLVKCSILFSSLSILRPVSI